jgi:hypothetical protein
MHITAAYIIFGTSYGPVISSSAEEFNLYSECFAYNFLFTLHHLGLVNLNFSAF